MQLHEPLSPKSAKKLGMVHLESWLIEPSHLSGSSQDDGDMVAEGRTSTCLFQRSRSKYTVDVMTEIRPARRRRARALESSYTSRMMR